MPGQRDKDEEDGMGVLGIEDKHSEVPPRSTEAEPPTPAVAVVANGGLDREKSREISLHFKDMKDMELHRQRLLNQSKTFEECPITGKEKDHHWTPTYDGSVRPRLELSYVEPSDYKDAVSKLHPSTSAQQVPELESYREPVIEEDEDSEEEEDIFLSPPHMSDQGTSKPKKKKKKKKKKQVKIVENKNK